MKLRNVRMPNPMWSDLTTLAEIRDQHIGQLVRETLAALIRRNRAAIDQHREKAS